MEKTEKDIERDVFRIIRDSALGQAVTGTMYRAGQRPKDASTEDIVVKFLTGVDGQEQSGIVLVHIYVPDVESVNGDGELVEDLLRVSELERIANEVCRELADPEYWFVKDGTPTSYPAEDVAQHFINIRLHYRRKTF